MSDLPGFDSFPNVSSVAQNIVLPAAPADNLIDMCFLYVFFCFALFSPKNEVTALYTFNDDDDDVHLYSAVAACYCSMLGTLS